jgi:hypothetical protein
MDEGLATMIFMGLVLKIPVVGAAWLIWHAIRSEPDPAEAVEDEGGSTDDRHFRREPKRPRDPRRGPHAPGSLPLPCPDGDGALRVHRKRVALGSAEEHRR